ncbi:MAG: putative lipid II flippase FtsW [Acidobacteriia bacterium]|nr:putative lipid II flippase FtsW [Terriglobia bacterium]
MARKLTFDRYLIAATFGLIFYGLLMVYSASATISMDLYGSSYIFLGKQALGLVIGLVCMIVAMNCDYRKWRNPTFVFSFLFVCQILLVAVFFLDRSHNTHRWIKLGLFSFQPSEMSKLALIFFFAYFLESRLHQVNDIRRTLLPAVMVMGLTVALVLKEPDFGTAIASFFICAAILFVAGVDWRWFAAVPILALPVFYWEVYRVAYRFDRITTFIDPWKDPLGKGFQIIQSLIAIGSGGLGGVGWVQGKQKLFYLPEPQNDFIFSVVGEELGLWGTVLIVILFAVVLKRGLKASLAAPDSFGTLLGVGLTAMIACQALINISVVTGLLPTKGIPLPFMSAGGSSLIVNCFAVGVLLNLSQHSD